MMGFISKSYFGFLKIVKRMHSYLYQISVQKKCMIGKGVRLFLTSSISTDGVKETISIGDCSQIHGNIVAFGETSKIKIGQYCFIGPSTRIWSMDEIIIGDRVLISHNVHIIDSNSHSISATSRHFEMMQAISGTRDFSNSTDVSKSSIKIFDDVWIGFGAVILKGVSIGKGAIIGANAIITHDVPDYSIVVGSPQRVVGSSKP